MTKTTSLIWNWFHQPRGIIANLTRHRPCFSPASAGAATVWRQGSLSWIQHDVSLSGHMLHHQRTSPGGLLRTTKITIYSRKVRKSLLLMNYCLLFFHCCSYTQEILISGQCMVGGNVDLWNPAHRSGVGHVIFNIHSGKRPEERSSTSHCDDVPLTRDSGESKTILSQISGRRHIFVHRIVGLISPCCFRYH